VSCTIRGSPSLHINFANFLKAEAVSGCLVQLKKDLNSELVGIFFFFFFRRKIEIYH
jgi:hypothetical protein